MSASCGYSDVPRYKFRWSYLPSKLLDELRKALVDGDMPTRSVATTLSIGHLTPPPGKKL